MSSVLEKLWKEFLSLLPPPVPDRGNCCLLQQIHCLHTFLHCISVSTTSQWSLQHGGRQGMGLAEKAVRGSGLRHAFMQKRHFQLPMPTILPAVGDGSGDRCSVALPPQDGRHAIYYSLTRRGWMGGRGFPMVSWKKCPTPSLHTPYLL